MNFENLSGNKENKNEVKVPEVRSKETIELLRKEIGNKVFEQYMQKVVLDNFIDLLEEGDFTNEQMQEFRAAIGSLSDKEIFALLSVPHELRNQYIASLKKEIETGGKSIGEIIKGRAERASKLGYSIGFHTSPSDIQLGENERWNIKGTDKDHRNNDMPMAYYSTQYLHLFHMKNPKFIYIVRAQAPEIAGSGHYSDGNWSRAGSLDIIARVPFNEVYSYVETQMRENAALEKNEKPPVE